MKSKEPENLFSGNKNIQKSGAVKPPKLVNRFVPTRCMSY